MESLRQFLKSSAGRAAGVVLSLACVAAAVFALRGSLGDGAAASASRDRVYVCATTGKTFEHEVQRGDVIPVRSPHSGERTGYPAELCFWKADGGIKQEPTYVLLNERVGKPGSTFCPDCDRLVVALNPSADPGLSPPPRKSEYKPPTERRR